MYGHNTMTSDEGSTKRRGQRKPQQEDVKQKGKVTDKQALVWYDAESWGDAKDGIRKWMRVIETRMTEMDTKLKQVIRKYEECVRLRQIAEQQPEERLAL